MRAEQAGYESIWVSDHLVVPESGGRLPPLEILEPIATLAYVANPFVLAKLPYNTEKDLAPVSLVTLVPLVLT